MHKDFSAIVEALAVRLASTGPASAQAMGVDALFGGVLSAPDQAHRQAYRQRRLLDEALVPALSDLLQRFEQANVQALILKGEAWAREIYPALGLRQRQDVDIWVAPRSRERAFEVLQSAGYCAKPSAWGRLVLAEQTFSAGLLSIDLHWQLSSLSALLDEMDFAALWHRRVPIAGLPGHRLSNVDSLLHAALHAAAHHRGALRTIWLIDGWLLWRRLDVAARAQLWDRAEHAGLTGTLVGFLGHVRDALDPSIDLPWPTAGQHDFATAAAIKWLLSLGSWSTRGAVIADLVFPNPDYLRWRYPTGPLWWKALRRLGAAPFRSKHVNKHK